MVILLTCAQLFCNWIGLVNSQGTTQLPYVHVFMCRDRFCRFCPFLLGGKFERWDRQQVCLGSALLERGSNIVDTHIIRTTASISSTNTYLRGKITLRNLISVVIQDVITTNMWWQFLPARFWILGHQYVFHYRLLITTLVYKTLFEVEERV